MPGGAPMIAPETGRRRTLRHRLARTGSAPRQPKAARATPTHRLGRRRPPRRESPLRPKAEPPRFRTPPEAPIARDREAENPETPPCEGGLSAASTESRSRDPRPPPRTPPASSTGEPASPQADAAPLSNASGSAPRGRDGSRLGRGSARVKDYFQHRSWLAAARSREAREARLPRQGDRKARFGERPHAGPTQHRITPARSCRR